MPVDYKQSKIYKIVNSENAIEYIGSTAQKLITTRMAQHRCHSKEGGRPFYEAMQEIGPEKFRILLIKNFPCGSKAELEAEEYRVLDQQIAAGVEVYNDRIGGKLSATALKKIADAQAGKKNHRFDFGSIGLYANGKYQEWRFQFAEDGKQRSKTFAVKKYGFWGAKSLAEAERKTKYPEWQTDEELELTAFQNIQI